MEYERIIVSVRGIKWYSSIKKVTVECKQIFIITEAIYTPLHMW